MTLLLDVGNTRVKWARVVDGALGNRGEGAYPSSAALDWLRERWADLGPVARIVASSVARGAIEEAITQWAHEQSKVEVEWVSARPRGWGVTCGYRDPKSLGPDRWAGLIAARRRCLGPACVVDCGTTVTMDVLARNGGHRGGLIMPGITLMRRYLFDHTARLEPGPNGRLAWMARNTDDAVVTGTSLAVVSLVERVVRDAVRELGEPVTSFVTGGDAETVLELLDVDPIHCPALVLEGLAVIARDAP